MNPITSLSTSTPFHSHSTQNQELNTSFLKSSLTNCELETVSQNSQEPSCITRFLQSILQFFRSLFCLDRCVKSEDNKASVETFASEEVEPSGETADEELYIQRLFSFKIGVIDSLRDFVKRNTQTYLRSKSLIAQGALIFEVRTSEDLLIGRSEAMFVTCNSFELTPQKFEFTVQNLPETLKVVYIFKYDEPLVGVQLSNSNFFYDWTGDKYSLRLT